MYTVCQACGYERKPTDQEPDWECPSCGKAYVKTSSDSSVSIAGHAQSLSHKPADRLHEKSIRQKKPGGPTGYIAVYGSALIFILVMLNGSDGSHQWPVAEAGLVMPCIAVLLAYACRESLLREWGQGASVILFASIGLLVAGVGFLALFNSLAFEPAKAWHKGIIVAIPFWLACAGVARSLDREVKQISLLLLGTLLLGLAYFYGGALIALGNRHLDHNNPTVYQVPVTGKHIGRTSGRGAHTYYAVTLQPWGPISNESQLDVSRSDYAAITPGRSLVCMAAYPGAFGIAWRQQVSCSE